MRNRYYLSIPDVDTLAGAGAFAFRARGAEGIAAELQAALRGDDLFRRWAATLGDPDDVDAALGATDPEAIVTGAQSDLHLDLVATTGLPGSVLKHRLGLLAGHGWQLRDVTAA
jgi:hypothetical protein